MQERIMVKPQTTYIHPLPKERWRSRKPINMHRLDLKPEQYKLLQEQALSIFVDCSNAGLPLQDSLAAILASGIDWGLHLTKQIKENT